MSLLLPHKGSVLLLNTVYSPPIRAGKAKGVEEPITPRRLLPSAAPDWLAAEAAHYERFMNQSARTGAADWASSWGLLMWFWAGNMKVSLEYALRH